MKNQKRTEVNLNGKDALDKIREIADEANACFFCTDIKSGLPMSVRPMSILQVDDRGYLWFMTSNQTHKNEELADNPFVHLLMQSGPRSGFLNLYGISEEVQDSRKLEELWDSSLELWFDGPEDPDIVLLRVEVLEGHYWDNKSSAVIAVFKRLKSLLTGELDNDGIEGDITI